MDINDYGPEKFRGYRYILVVIDNFSKFGWTVSFKNKNSLTITNSFENFPIGSKRKLNLIQSDRGEEFYNSIVQNFLNNFKRYSGKTPLGAVFAQFFNKSVRKILKKPIFEKRDGNCIDVLSTITKQNRNRVHSSAKLTLIQAFLEKNERYVYKKNTR